MDWSAKWKFALLLLVIATFFACSRQETQKTLARRLSGVDRVTIADKFGDHGTFTMLLTPEETSRFVQAISTAKEESPLITAVPELRIQFFKGTNVLGAFDIGVKAFWIDHGLDPRTGLRRVTPYSDHTGTLEALAQKFRHEKGTAQTTTNRTAR